MTTDNKDDDDKVVNLGERRLRALTERHMRAVLAPSAEEEELQTQLLDTMVNFKNKIGWERAFDALAIAMTQVMGEAQVSGMSLIKRLCHWMDMAILQSWSDPDGYADWFMEDIPRELIEYEDLKFFEDHNE